MSGITSILTSKFPLRHSQTTQQLAGFFQQKRFKSKSTFYEILELKQDCTQDQIKNSFVRLSKLHHPDSKVAQEKNGNINSKNDGKHFHEIVEAYKVLGKQDSRFEYDRSLQFDYPYDRVNKVEYDSQIFRPNKHGFTDPSSYPPPKEPYYGINAIKGRLSNKLIVLCCLIFAGIGIATQTVLVSHSLTFRRQRLEENSAKISRAHADLKADAEEFGNQIQMEKLKRRLQAVDKG